MKKMNTKKSRKMRRKQCALMGALLFAFAILTAQMPVNAAEGDSGSPGGTEITTPETTIPTSTGTTAPSTTMPSPDPATPDPAAPDPATPDPATPTTPTTTPTTPEQITPITESTIPDPATTFAATPSVQAEGTSDSSSTTDASTGLNETTEDYSIPDGEATVQGFEKDVTYTNDAAANAIQNALTDAITYASTIAADKTATIVVKDGTYLGGITINRSSESTLGKILLDMIGKKVAAGLDQDTAQKEAEETIGGITIRIVAEDALGSNGEILTTSAGNVDLQGAIDISGLNVILAGIYLSSNGTIGISSTDAFEYYGTAKEDTVNIVTDNVSKKIVIDGGAGDDNISFTVKQAPNFTINLTQADLNKIVTAGQTVSQILTTLATTPYADWGKTKVQDGEQEITLTDLASRLAGSLVGVLNLKTSYDDDITTNISVNGGAGNDKVDVKLINSTSLTSGLMSSLSNPSANAQMTPEELAAMSLLNFKLDLSKVNLTINGGAGSDRLNVSGGMSLDLTHMFLDILREKIMEAVGVNTEGLLSESGNSRVTLNGNAGDDVLQIDTTTGFSSYRNVDYTVEGGDGYDRIHLTGKLENDADYLAGDSNLRVHETGTSQTTVSAKTIAEMTFLTLEIGNEETFKGVSIKKRKGMEIHTNGIESYTDALAYKNSVNLTADKMAADQMASDTISSPTSYTDYILQAVADQKDISHINYQAIVNGTIPVLYFTNLIIELANGSKELVIEKLLATYFNIIASAEKIKVAGAVSGRNVILQGETENAWGISADLVTSDLSDKTVDAEGDESLGINFEVDSPVTDINITVAEDGSIYATEAIDLTVKSEQDGFYLSAEVLGKDVLDDLGINLLSFKMGNATIDILGKLEAKGLISALSEVIITSETTWSKLGKVIPVSAHIAIVDSHVAVGKNTGSDPAINTEITSSKGSILLKALSYTKLDTLARAGFAPLSIAVDVVASDTYVTVVGGAVLSAFNDIFLMADTVIRTTAIATGKPVVEGVSGSASGVFVATIVIVNNTFTRVLDHAALTAGNDITLHSVANVSANSAAISVPSDATGKIKPKSVIQCIEKLAGIQRVDGKQSSTQGNLIAKLTGSNLLANLFDTGTSGAVDKTDKTTTQFVGAIGVNVVMNDNLAEINTDKKIKAGSKLNLDAYADTISYAKGDGSLYKTPNLIPGISLTKEPDNAVGIGTAVSYYEHKNRAVIGAGEVEAAELNVTATTGKSISSVISKAGHIPTKSASLGIGGAITVHVASDNTTAAVNNGKYTIGTAGKAGNISVVATANHTYITVADASGKRQTKQIGLPAGFIIPITKDEYNAVGTGIGAGIAVFVGGGDVEARIADGVLLQKVPGDANKAAADNVTVIANRVTKETVIAEAGAGSGKAVAPVVATTVSGYSTESVLGFGTSSQDYYLGNVIVGSDNEVIRKIKADAKAIGASAGAGGAFGVVVINDSSSASLKRNVNAVNIHVVAKGVSRLTLNSKASAAGAAPATVTGKDADTASGSVSTIITQIKDMLNSGSSAGTTPGGSSENSFEKQNEKGKADQTTDQNIAAGKKLSGSVNSKNVNPDKIEKQTANRQQASTSEGNVQVAAAMAVNVMTHLVEAMVGSGLTLTARKAAAEENSGAILIEAVNDTDGTIKADASATKSETGVGVAAAVNVVNYTNRAVLGDSKINASKLTITADTLEAADAETLEEILTELVDFLVTAQGTELLITILNDQLGKGVTFDSLINDKVNELNADGTLTEVEAIAKAKAEVRENLVSQVVSRLTGEKAKDATNDLVHAVVESLLKETLDKFLDPNNLINLVLTGSSGALKKMEDKISLMSKVMKSKMERLLNTYLRSKFGSNDEMEGVGSKISTTAISGAGAANIGIAGAVAVTVIDALTEATVADHVGDRAENDVNISGDVNIYARSVQDVYTTATGAADKAGAPDKNKNASSSSTGDSSSSKSVGVGAAASTVVIDTIVNAGIGENRNLTANNVNITGLIYDDVETIAVAGSDPIARRQAAEERIPNLGEAAPAVKAANSAGTKDISVDASAAVGLIDNAVNVSVGKNTIVTAKGDFTLLGEQHGETYTTASAFAVGSSAAVGACAAINLPKSVVTVLLAGIAYVSGKTNIKAYTYDADESHAYAAVTGASLERYFGKIRDMLQFGSINAGQPTNSLNATMMNKLNGTIGSAKSGAAGAAAGMKNYLPASVAALLSQDASTEAAPSTTNSASGSNAMNAAGGQVAGTGVGVGGGADESASKKQSINIAAAVAVSVTKHSSIVIITGAFHNTNKTNETVIIAENHGNFRTHGTGAVVTGGKDAQNPSAGDNNISLGVAVSTNQNKAIVQISGDMITLGDVKIDSVLTQNMDGVYRGLLGAQALAGNLSGNGGTIGFSGAIAILIGEAKSQVIIADGITISGKDITINAEDKSKYAVRAGSATVSKGASAGIGASYAMIYAGNQTMVLIGEDVAIEKEADLKGIHITADNLTITVKKLKVDASDYKFPFDVSTLLTVDVTDQSKQGLVNLTTTGGPEDKYSINITFKSADLLKVIDMMNYLASVNYYAEAIAGSIIANGDQGQSSVAVAGSMTMIYLKNITKAVIGDKVTITLRDKGNLKIDVLEDTNTRMISGSLSASQAKVGVGVAITTLVDTQEVGAQLADHVTIQTDGDVTLQARNISDLLVITVAASATTGKGLGSVGGALNVVDSEAVVVAGTGRNSQITAEDISITTDGSYDILLVNAAIAGSQNVAVGGTIAVVLTDNKTHVYVLDDSTWMASGKVTIASVSNEKLINVLASASGSTGKDAVAGSLGVLIADSMTKTELGNRVKITAIDSISLLAEGNVKQLMIIVAIAGTGGKVAAGATVTVDVFSHDVLAVTGTDCILTSANGDVLIQATGKDDVLIVTMAGAGGPEIAVAGAIPVVVTESNVKAEAGERAVIAAKGSVGVIADLISDVYNIAGGVAGGGNAAVGATIATLVMENNVTASVGNHASITAYALTGTGIKLPNRDERRKGLAVYSNLAADLLVASVGGAAAGTLAIGGVIDTIVLNNKVMTSIGNHVSANAREVRDKSTGNITSSTKDDEASDDADVHIEAYNQAHLYHFAGALAASGGTGIGATVATTIFNNVTKAQMGDGCHIYARDIKVIADSYAKLPIVIVTFAAAGGTGIAGAASIVLFDNETESSVGMQAYANATREILIHANSYNEILSVAVAFAGGSVAAGAVAPVVKFTGSTIAHSDRGTVLIAAGDVSIIANSEETIETYGAGAAAGGNGIAGTAEVLITQLTTKAYTGDNVRITANSITVKATDQYKLTGAAGAIAAGGSAGVGISVLVSLSYNTVSASLGNNNQLRAGKDIIIQAESGRDISVYAVTGAVGGSAGVAGTVVVVLAGSKLTADSAAEIKKNDIDLQGNVSHALDSSGNQKAQGYGEKAEVGSFFSEDNIEADASSTSGAVDGSDFDLAGENTGKPSSSGSSEDQYTVNEGNVDDTAKDTVRPTPDANSDKKDAITAYVGTNSILIADQNITIYAVETVSLDILTGALGVGGNAGIGVGVSVAILYSNVLAYTGSNVTLDAKGNITVQAEGKGKNTTTSDHNNKAMAGLSGENKPDPGYTLRSLTVAAAVGGYAGVSVPIASIDIYTVVRAYIGTNSTVRDAALLIVEADSNYGKLTVWNIGLGAGLAGVNASVTRANYDAQVAAYIGADSTLYQVKEIRLRMNSDTTLTVKGASVAGGVVGVNGTVILAFYTADMEMFIGQGTNTVGCGALSMVLNAKTEAKAEQLSIAGGAVGVGVSVVIVKLTPTFLNYIGITPAGYTQNPSSVSLKPVSERGTMQITSLNMKNDVTSKANVTGFSVAAGGIAANGLVALAINRTNSVVGISGTNVNSTGDIRILALLDGYSDVNASAVTGAVIGVGAIAGYSELKTVNQAMIDLTDAVVTAQAVSIQAGDEGSVSKAETTIATGAVAGISASINIAFANNAYKNYAGITGAGTLQAAGDINVIAQGKALTNTEIHGLSAGAITVGVALAYSYLRAVSHAEMTGASVTGKNITVASYLNNTADYTVTSQAFASAGALITVNGSVALSISEAQNIAKVSGNVKANGNFNVLAYGNAKAKASAEDYQVGLITIGLRFATAIARGTYSASIERNRADRIEASALTVQTKADTDAYGITKTALGGVQVSFASVNVNSAYAETSSDIKAFITETGTGTTGALIASDNVLVEAIGSGRALADAKGTTYEGLSEEAKKTIDSSKYKLTASSAYANMNTVMKAYVEKQSAMTVGGSMDVHAYLNNNVDKAQAIRNHTNGAYATAGSSASVNISFIGGEISNAYAKEKASVLAAADGNNLTVTGRLAILTSSNQLVYAVIDSSNFGIGGGIGAVNTTAIAEGTYIARLSVRNSNHVQAGSLIVQAVLPVNTAEAKTQFLDGGIITVTSLSAEAFNNAVVKAYITGDQAGEGTLNVLGNAEIKAESVNTIAYATVLGLTAGAGVKIGNALTMVELNSDVQAYTEGAITIITDGDLTITANNIGEAKPYATNSVGVALIAISGAESFAKTNMNTKASLGNANTQAGGNINIRAYGKSDLKMTNQKAGVEALGIGAMFITTKVTNKVSAAIQKTAAVSAKGNIVVKAEGYDKEDLVSEAITAGVVNGTSITEKAENNTLTEVVIGDGAKVNATGDITIDAYNEVQVRVRTLDVKAAGLKLGAYVITTNTISKALAGIGANTVIAAGGNIAIYARDMIDVTNETILLFAGIAGGTASVTTNKARQETKVTIGNAAVITAGRDIEIGSATDHRMSITCKDSSLSVGSVVAVVIKNELTRECTVVIGDYVKMISDKGNITIFANSVPSVANDIKTDTFAMIADATGTAAGLFDGAGAEANNILNSKTAVTIGKGGTIQATYGKVTIHAQTGSSIYSNAQRSAAAAISASVATAKITLNNPVTVTINGTANEKANIIGTVVEIAAVNAYQNLSATAITDMLAAGAVSKANVIVRINGNTSVFIYGGNIRGFEQVYIHADATNINHYFTTHSEITGAVGVVYATTDVSGDMKATVYTDPNTEIASADVDIEATAPKLNSINHVATAEAVANTILYWVFEVIAIIVKWVMKAVAWVVGLFSKKAKKKIEEKVYGWVEKIKSTTAYPKLTDTFSMDAELNLNGKVSVGGAAAGIVVDIDADGNVSVVGVEDKNWLSKIVIDRNKKTIIIPYIYNRVEGSLSLYAGEGLLYGNLAVYLNNYLPFITFNNDSDYTLILSDITVFNTDVNPIDIAVTARNYNNNLNLIYGNETPVITINAVKASDVILNGEINNVKGSLNFIMNGGSIYVGEGGMQDKDELLRGDTEFLTKMFEGTNIWVNTLSIKGANNVGNSADNRLMIGLIRYTGFNQAGMITEAAKDAIVDIEVLGSIFASFALLETIVSEETLSDAVLDNMDPIKSLYLKHIKAGKTADIYLPAAKRLYVYKDGTNYEGMEIAYPGEYTDMYLYIPAAALGEGESYIIKDTGGNATNYVLTQGGLFMLTGEVSVDSDTFLNKELEKLTIGTEIQTVYVYTLPDETMVYVTKDGDVLFISSKYGTDERALDLSDIRFEKFSDETMKLVFNDSKDDNDSYITINKDGTGTLHVGANGLTIAVQQTNDGSWNLPNGIKIHTMFILIDENSQLVTTTYLGTYNGYKRYMIGNLATNTANNTYYVFDIATDKDGKSTFHAAYKYTASTISTAGRVELKREQTLEDAAAVVEEVIKDEKWIDTELKAVTAESLLAYKHQVGTSIANPISTLLQAVKTKVTTNIEVTINLTQQRRIVEVSDQNGVRYVAQYQLIINLILEDTITGETTKAPYTTIIDFGNVPYLEDAFTGVNTLNQSQTGKTETGDQQREDESNIPAPDDKEEGQGTLDTTDPEAEDELEKKHVTTVEEAQQAVDQVKEEANAGSKELTENTLKDVFEKIQGLVSSEVHILITYTKAENSYDAATRKFNYIINIELTAEGWEEPITDSFALEKAALTTTIENATTVVEDVLGKLELDTYTPSQNVGTVISNKIAADIAKKVDGNIQITVTLTQVEEKTNFTYAAAIEGFAATVNGYIYNYIVTVVLKDLSSTAVVKEATLTYSYNDKKTEGTPTAIAAALSSQKWLMGTKPFVVVTEDAPGWSNNKTDTSSADGTRDNYIRSGDGYELDVPDKGVKQAAQVEESTSAASGYVLNYGRFTFVIEKLEATELETYKAATYKLKDASFEKEKQQAIYDLLSKYIWSIQNETLTIFTLAKQDAADADIFERVAGNIVFTDGNRLVVNRIVAEYPGYLLDDVEDDQTRYVFVSLSPASDDVADQERTLYNSIVYVSYLSNQLKVNNPLGGFKDEKGNTLAETIEVFETMDKSLIYAPVTIGMDTTGRKLLAKANGNGTFTTYYYVGYVDYLADGSMKYYVWAKEDADANYKDIAFDPVKDYVEQPTVPVQPEEGIDDYETVYNQYTTDLAAYPAKQAAYEKYLALYTCYVEMFAATSKSIPIYDRESNIVFDKTKGQGIIITPAGSGLGSVYYQYGIKDFNVIMSTESDGKYLKISETEQIKINNDGLHYEYLRPVTDEHGNVTYEVYASRNLSKGEIKWYTENGTLTFATADFANSKVTLSSGYQLTGSRVSDNVVTLLNGSEYFYIKNAKEDGNGKFKVEEVIYADKSTNPNRQIWLVQTKADGMIIEIKEVLEETNEYYLAIIADNTVEGKQRTVKLMKTDLVGGMKMQAISIRDEEYNPVMIAIETALGKYYIFPNGYTIGLLNEVDENGDQQSVFFISQIVIEKFRHTQEVTGSGYRVGDMKAETVILTFGDEHAVITDEYVEGTDAAITADTIHIITSTDQTIGSKTSPFRIHLTSQVGTKGFYLGNADGTFAGTAFIKATADDLTMEDVALAAGSYLELTSVGSIAVISGIRVMKGATLILNAAKDIGLSNQYFALAVDEGGNKVQILNAENIYLNGGADRLGTLNLELPATGISGIINVTNTGDIILNLPLGDMHIGKIQTNGKLSLTAVGDVIIQETVGDLQIEKLETTGDIALTVTGGNLTTVDGTIIKGKNLMIRTVNLGTSAKPVKSAMTGTLDIETTGNLYLYQQADMIIKNMKAGRNIMLQTEGSIQTAPSMEQTIYHELQILLEQSAQALADYNKAVAEAEAAEKYAEHLKENIASVEAKRAEAEERGLEGAKELAELDQILTVMRAKAADADGDGEGTKTVAQVEAEAKRAAVALTLAVYQQKLAEVEAKKTELANATKEAVIQSLGSMELISGSNIGSKLIPLVIKAGGALNARAKNIYLGTAGNILLGTITADKDNGELSILAGGSIRNLSPVDILTADTGKLVSLNGDIGSSSLPVTTSFNKATLIGNNIYNYNNKKVVANLIHAKGEAVLTVIGDIIGDGDGVDIIADKLKLHANGSIGNEGQPLNIQSGKLNLYAGKSMFTNLITPEAVIESAEAKAKIQIEATGDILAQNPNKVVMRAPNIKLMAMGYIGRPGSKLRLSTNDVVALSDEQQVHLYSEEYKEFEPDPIPDPDDPIIHDGDGSRLYRTTSQAGGDNAAGAAQTGDYSPIELYLLIMLLALVGMAGSIATKRKREK